MKISGARVLEPTLMVIGINFHTAPVGVRERFWIPPSKRRHTLAYLADAEGIEEALVLVTCKSTEFLLWASDATLAANSVLRLLSSEYSLQLCEWEHFYRLLGEDALTHVFRVASGLDSLLSGDPEAAIHLKEAREEAQRASVTGRHLDSVLQKAFDVSEKIRSEASMEQTGVSIASLAVESATDMFESLQDRRIVLIGAGRMGELVARALVKRGAMALRILDLSYDRALGLAQKFGGVAVPCEDLLEEVTNADLAVFCAATGDVLLHLGQVKRMLRQRKDHLLCILDLGLPRNVDGGIRDLDGVFLYDLDDLRNASANSGLRNSALARAESTVAGEARDFHRNLSREHILPMIVVLRERLEQLGRAELETFRRERGPFPREQERLLAELTSYLTRGLATSLVRQLKEVHEKAEQAHLAEAVQRLFQIEAEQDLVTR